MDRFRWMILAAGVLAATSPACRKSPPRESARTATPIPAPAAPDVAPPNGEIREADQGRTFAVDEGDRFVVILDQAKHPQQTLDVLPRGSLARDADAPSVAPPLYAAGFRAVKPGTSLVTAKGFLVRVQVRERPKPAS
jgi:hypothetical protein